MERGEGTSAQHDVDKQIDPVEAYGLAVEGEKASPLFQSREVAEKFTYPWNPNRRAYGALPHLKSKEETLALFRDEAAYFGKTYQPKEPGAPPWRDASYGEGMIMFEAKFGRKLSEFAEEILAQYPQLDGTEKGKMISLFGLSGSGKSTALEALRDIYGDKAIEMDSDTVRFNLLAEMLRDVEIENGATLEEVRSQLIHNNISGPLYLLLGHVTKILQERGYTVVRSSTMPESGADVSIYVAHPDGVDPRTITDDQIPVVAKTLFERTQGRVQGSDDYDWDHAQTVTDFRQMKPVTVQVPENVHGIFLKNTRSILTSPSARFNELRNERNDDPVARKKQFREQFETILAGS